MSAVHPRSALRSHPNHEASHWLREAVAGLVTSLLRFGLDPDDLSGPLVVVPLGGTTTPGTRADRTCDRCRRFVPDDAAARFVLVKHQARARLVVTLGLCDRCHTAEYGR